MIVCYANNPASTFDEYDIFSKVVYKLRQTGNSKLTEWEGSLDESQKSFWNELIHTRRVDLNIENKTSFNVPRRIVKVKRSLNENNQ